VPGASDCHRAGKALWALAATYGGGASRADFAGVAGVTTPQQVPSAIEAQGPEPESSAAPGGHALRSAATAGAATNAIASVRAAMRALIGM
jgi:hypothetical protein